MSAATPFALNDGQVEALSELVDDELAEKTAKPAPPAADKARAMYPRGGDWLIASIARVLPFVASPRGRRQLERRAKAFVSDVRAYLRGTEPSRVERTRVGVAAVDEARAWGDRRPWGARP